MKTYKETIDWLAEKSHQRFMSGSDSPMIGRYEASVVSFVFDVPNTIVFDDFIDKYNKLIGNNNASTN